MSWLDGVSVGFELLGAVCFLVSIGFWTANLLRSRKVGILDYSMFALHPLFILCTLFSGILLVAAVSAFLERRCSGLPYQHWCGSDIPVAACVEYGLCDETRSVPDRGAGQSAERLGRRTAFCC